MAFHAQMYWPIRLWGSDRLDHYALYDYGSCFFWGFFSLYILAFVWCKFALCFTRKAIFFFFHGGCASKEGEKNELGLCEEETINMMRRFNSEKEPLKDTFVCHTVSSLSVLFHHLQRLLSVERSVCVAVKVAVFKCAIQIVVQNGEQRGKILLFVSKGSMLRFSVYCWFFLWMNITKSTRKVDYTGTITYSCVERPQRVELGKTLQGFIHARPEPQ